MNIKTRLSFQFTLIVVVILLFFSALAYYFSYTSQRTNFRGELLDKGKNTAILLINVTEVDSSLLKKIHQSTVSFQNEEIAITDSALTVIYSDKIQYLTPSSIQANAHKGDIIYFSIGYKDGVCYKHRYKNTMYYVFVMAFDKSRKKNLSELRGILFWSIIFSTWLSGFMSYFFSKNAVQPISRIIRHTKEINSSRLNERLNEGNRKDEIAQLAITFNELLANLEIAFKNQEEFVSNASHELRTPLTVMIVELDYLLNQKRKPEEYISHYSNLEKDLKKLNTLLNSLLELAQMNSHTAIQLSEVRVDEIMYNAIDEIKTKHEGRKILLKIQYPEHGNDLLIHGNAGLLAIACKNLIDNACKFSEGEVVIEFLITETSIKICITDTGIGIPPEDMESIYIPFKRASNVKFKAGFGIGLSLVAKIIELHEADLTVDSKVNEGSRFELVFDRVMNSEKNRGFH